MRAFLGEAIVDCPTTSMQLNTMGKAVHSATLTTTIIQTDRFTLPENSPLPHESTTLIVLQDDNSLVEKGGKKTHQANLTILKADIANLESDEHSGPVITDQELKTVGVSTFEELHIYHKRLSKTNPSL